MPTLTSKISQAKNTKYDLVVVDGRNLSFKYFFGMANLENGDGVKTGLYHGFLSFILKTKLENPGCRIVIAWEGGLLERKKISSDYKSSRVESNKELETSIKRLQEVLGLMGIEQKFIRGYEADDVASSLVRRSKKRVLLVSTDNDWWQMSDEKCDIKIRDKIYSSADLMKTIGIPLARLVFYNAIKGSHNGVKGIPFFPKKLAMAIAKSSSRIEDIFDFRSSDSSHQKWISVLEISRDLIVRNYELVKLKDDGELENVECPAENSERLKKLLIRLQLFQVMKKLKTLRELS